MKQLYILLCLKLMMILSAQAQTTPCSPQVTIHSSQSAGSIYAYNFSLPTNYAGQHDSVIWRVNGIVRGTGAQLSYNFNAPGVYNVCVRVEKYMGTTNRCVSENCTSVTISSQPPCSLAAPVIFDSLLNNNSVYLSLISGGISHGDTITVEFGDGTPAFIQYANLPIIHNYAHPGNYNVCATVRRNALCSVRVCRTITVPSPACTINPAFTYTVDPTNRNKINFLSTTVGLTSTDSVKWTFGDGTSGSGLNPSHIYATGGNFNVCMRLIRRATTVGFPACERTVCTNISIQSNACTLSGSFRDSIVAGNLIGFSSMINNLLQTDTIKWEFGDGTPAAYGLNTNHLFAQPGTYNMCMIVKRNAGCSLRVCKTIAIPFPTATNCTINPVFNAIADSANHLQVTFNNLTAGTLSSDTIRWTFGDGTSGSGAHVSHTYHAAGTYNVCMRIIRRTLNGATCERRICMPVIVNRPQCALQLYPNPASSSVSVALNMARPGQARFRIFNSSNVVVFSQVLNLAAGSQSVTLNINNLPAGIYRLVANYNDRECSNTLIKR